MVEERTHKSLWTVSAPARRYPALQGDLEVDVVVIGGGIAGLTTAWLLKQEGKRVAVLEMHRLISMDTSGLEALQQLHRVLQRRDIALRLNIP